MSMSFKHEIHIAVNIAYKALAEEGHLAPTLVGFSGERVFRAQFPGDASEVNVALVAATLRAIEADRYVFAYQGSLTTPGATEAPRTRDGIFVISADAHKSQVLLFPFDRDREGHVFRFAEPEHLTIFTPLTALLREGAVTESEIDAWTPRVKELIQHIRDDESD